MKGSYLISTQKRLNQPESWLYHACSDRDPQAGLGTLAASEDTAQSESAPSPLAISEAIRGYLPSFYLRDEYVPGTYFFLKSRYVLVPVTVCTDLGGSLAQAQPGYTMPLPVHHDFKLRILILVRLVQTTIVLV